MRLWKRFVAVWLGLALLASWQTALEHPLDHLDEHGHFIHLYGNDGGDARGQNDGHEGDPSDRLGDSLAALTACAAAALPSLAAGPARHDAVIPWHQGTPRAAEAPPFLSHAPPASV